MARSRFDELLLDTDSGELLRRAAVVILAGLVAFPVLVPPIRLLPAP